MKKVFQISLLFIAVLVVKPGLLFGQEKQPVNYITYNNFMSEAEYYFYEAQYDSAAYYFREGFKYVPLPHPVMHYRYSISLWKTGKKEEAINQLPEDYYFKHHFETNQNLFAGMSSMIRDEILNKMREKSANEEEHVQVRHFVDSIMVLDQLVRKKEEERDSAFFRRMRVQDSLNGLAIIDFTKKYGFPAGVNAGWNQQIATYLLHANIHWFEENYYLLLEEVKKGNLEPWMLARGIDRAFAFVNNGVKISPNCRYYKQSSIDPFLMFYNCVQLGVSPYYDFNWHMIPEKTEQFPYFSEKKQFYNTTNYLKL